MTRDGKVKEGPGGRASDRTATGRTRKVDEIDVDVDATARDGVDLLDLLPRALIDDVVSRLDGVAVARLGMTCRRMRAATRSHATWRRLAEAQESAPSLTRLDLVTRDFTFRHLYAWRRHVLRYATAARGGVNRIAVANASRILTCDPVLGGGRAYVAHESDAGHPSARVLPHLTCWAPDGELLAGVQEHPDGCVVVVSAPPVTLRVRNLRGGHGGAEEEDDGGGAGEGFIPWFRPRLSGGGTGRQRGGECAFGPTGDEDSTAGQGNGAVAGGGGGGGGADDDEGGVAAAAAKATTTTKTTRRAVPAAPPPLPVKNELTLGTKKPLFAAFAPCGTRLAIMHVTPDGERVALHSLDLSVALASLYGKHPGAGAAAGAASGGDAREAIALMTAARELSFAFAPDSGDVLTFEDGFRVARTSRKPREPLVSMTEDAFDDDDDGGGGGAASGANGGGGGRPQFVESSGVRDDDDDDAPTSGEVSSAVKSLWWRRGVELASDSLEAIGAAMSSAMRTVGGIGIAAMAAATRGGVGGAMPPAKRRKKTVAPVNRGNRSANAKRARLAKTFSTPPPPTTTTRPTAKRTHARAIPTSRKVPASVDAAFARETVHETIVDGLAHIVQWVPPARDGPAARDGGAWFFGDGDDDEVLKERRSPRERGRMGTSHDADETETENETEDARGWWLVPVSFPDRVPFAAHLALIPAPNTAASGAALLNDASALDARVVAELTPPTVYHQYRAAVKFITSCAPGARIVCWADEDALWAKQLRGADRLAGEATALKVLDLRTCRFGEFEFLEGAASAAPLLRHVQAMQWSKSGERLLFLLSVHSADDAGAPSRATHQWCVWDPPRKGLDAAARRRDRDAPVSDRMDYYGSITRGSFHTPSATFLDGCLPAFEQFAATHSLWSPGEDAMCFPARRLRRSNDDDDDDDDDDETSEVIYVQKFPRGRRKNHLSQDFFEDGYLPFTDITMAIPVEVAEGSFCAWSPC